MVWTGLIWSAHCGFVFRALSVMYLLLNALQRRLWGYLVWLSPPGGSWPALDELRRDLFVFVRAARVVRAKMNLRV